MHMPHALFLGLSFANLPSPRSQDLDDFRGHGSRQGYPYENEAFVYSVRKGKLGGETYIT